MARVELPKDYGPTKSGFESLIDRHGFTGAPLIWPQDTDPDQVKRWRASGATVKERKPALRPPGGEFYSRTTKYIDCLDDQENLTKWKQRMTLYGAGVAALDMDAVRALDPEANKDKLNDLVGDCMKAARTDHKANLGTALHEVLEDIDSELDPGFIPPELEPGVEQYVLHTKGMKMLAIEQFGVEDTFKVAGTLDRVAFYRGKVVIADVKTSQSVEFAAGKFAMQMALYAHMRQYDPETFMRSELVEGYTVDTEVGYIIHMPSGGNVCNIYEVDLLAGWANVGLAQQVRLYRNWYSRKDNKPRLVAGTDYERR